MRILSTKAHGILDYLTGALLIAAPWLFDFARNGAETWVPVLLGIGTIIYSLVTDYEYGAYRKLSMKTHLMLDFISGAFLAVSPWLFNFDEYVYLPHLIVGIFEIIVASVTERSTEHALDHGDRSVSGTSHRHAH